MNYSKFALSIPQGNLRGKQFLLVLSASVKRIGFVCHLADGGIQQEVRVLHWTQANELTDQLTVISMRLGG